MQSLPTSVKNVSVYPYLPFGPGGLVVQAVLKNAEGTYAIGTLGTQVFYNLNLQGGEYAGQLQVNGTYYAIATDEQNQTFQTHWMNCLTTGDTPTFGLTQNMLQGDGGNEIHLHLHLNGTSDADNAQLLTDPAVQNPYITIAELEDVNVRQLFPPPAIGQIGLISNAKGKLIATRVGTPHQTGFLVEGGDRTGHLYTSMQNLIVSGKRVDNGDVISFLSMKCISAGDPAIFLPSFLAPRTDQNEIHIHLHR